MNDQELAGWAAELTGSTGVPDDDVGDYVPEPEALGDDGAVAEFEAYAADRDERLGLNDLDNDDQVDDGHVDDGQHTDRSKKQVPLGALQQERAKRQQVQAELQETQRRFDEIQRLAAQLQHLQQQAAVPAFEEDPQAHVEARFQQLEQRQQAEAHQRQVTAQVDFIDKQVTAAAPEVDRIEAEFTEATPDYPQAFEHLNNAVDERMRQQYPDKSPADHALAKRVAMLMFVRDAQSKGQNVAQLVYNQARALGFQANQRVPATGSRGQRGSSGISASRLSEMSDDEFNQLYADMQSKALVRPSFGG